MFLLTVPQIIWMAAVVLIAIALLVFAVLLLRRFVNELFEARRKRIRKQRVRTLLTEIREHPDRAPDSIDLPRRKRAAFEKTALALLDDLKGPERDALIRFLMAIGTMTRAINRMQSRRAVVRERSAAMLGIFPDDRARHQLTLALGDRDLAVRLAAASSLLMSGAEMDITRIMAEMDRDGALSRARALFHGKGSVELAQAAEPHLDEAKTKLFGLEIFGGSSGRIAAQTLVREIGHPDGSVKATALRAIRDEDHPALAEAVIDAIDNDDWKVQVEAVAAAGRLGLEDARPALEPLIENGEWQVRNAAAHALNRIGPNSDSAADR
ncbi:HEAT repeat domain-containing protein [Minwuia sp.]|uniref:HEAT repeat domain-containing protein n=1 Tax=Minwuia sp. TaxID=2493630 RepID=UPI003A8CE2AA